MASLATADLTPAKPAVGTAGRFLVPLCALVAVVRLSYVLRPLRNDEGGYLLSARQWRTGGEFMYGDFFVDRPPLLMLLFRIAALTEWDQAVRALVIPFVLAAVVAGWWAGFLLAGPTGGRWAAVTAAAFLCSPGVGSEQADGELFGATFVLIAIALALSAWHADTRRSQVSWAAAAGAAAACAPLVKQSLAEGLLVLGGLVVLGWWGGARSHARRVAGAGLLGALVPCGAVVLWLVAAGIAPADAWHDLVGSRGVAFDLLWATGPDDNVYRIGQLLVLGTLTGLLPVVLVWFAGRRSAEHRSPGGALITLLLVFGLVGVASGGAYWPPYLLQLVPAAVLAVGALAPSASVPGAWMRRVGRVVAAVALLGAVGSNVVYAVVPSTWSSQRTGEWLAESKAAGDTGLVVYGLPAILETADMTSPYPHLWSAALRTVDPEQTRLRATLEGRAAPEWIVQINGFDAWGIDDGNRLRDLVGQRYRVVTEICGYPVWLRQDLTRDLAAPPRC